MTSVNLRSALVVILLVGVVLGGIAGTGAMATSGGTSSDTGTSAADSPDSSAADTGADGDSAAPADSSRALGGDKDEHKDKDNGETKNIQCDGKGDLVAVALLGTGTGNENAENDDNLADVNLFTDSDHYSDCDLVDADVGDQNNDAEANNDGVDVDALTTNEAYKDNDKVDLDVGSTSTAAKDNDKVDVNILSEQSASLQDEDNVRLDVPPEGETDEADAGSQEADTGSQETDAETQEGESLETTQD